MNVLSGIEPEKVLKWFEYISSVPRGSHNTGAVSDLCMMFAEQHGLEYKQDKVNNIVIYAPATAGRENEPGLVLQGHLDMVCEKDPDSTVDMSVTPITIVKDGDMIRADGTTLGADNGLAIAMALAVLDSPDISHPSLECVFTVDEEVGMDGAAAIDPSWISGRRFLNLDSDEEGVFTCGCAGGVRANCAVPICRSGLGDGYVAYAIRIHGLLGGHSGGEIDKGRANSNVLMARMLYDIRNDIDIRLMSFEGGKFDNAIANDTTAVVYVHSKDKVAFANLLAEYAGIYADEYKTSDPGLALNVSETGEDYKKPFGAPLDSDSTRRSLLALWMIPFGVQEMSADMPGLVQTSLNPGIAALLKDTFEFSYSVRSSITSQKKMLVNKIKAVMDIVGGTLLTHGDYPGWQYSKVSPLRDHCAEIYRKMFGKDPVIFATHGGLECGLFSEKLPGLDCVSIGAELLDIHSPRERVSIASIGRTWDFVRTILETPF